MNNNKANMLPLTMLALNLTPFAVITIPYTIDKTGSGRNKNANHIFSGNVPSTLDIL